MSKSSVLRSACSEIATYFACMLTEGYYRRDIVVQEGEQIRSWALSVSEAAEYLLEHKLDLATQVSDQIHVLAKPTSAFPDHFESGRYDRCFDEILECYLGFLDWKGDVPTSRHWFTPLPKHRHILDLLADLGYLEASEREMRWTDLAGSAMLWTGVWTPDFQSHHDVKGWTREKEARQIAKNLSSDLVLLVLTDPKAAFWPIYQSLCGEAWTEMPDKLLVERVTEIIQSKNEPADRTKQTSRCTDLPSVVSGSVVPVFQAAGHVPTSKDR